MRVTVYRGSKMWTPACVFLAAVLGCCGTQGQVISEPDDVTICEGEGAVFPCVLNSNIRSDDVQWYRFIKDTSTTVMVDPNGANINIINYTNESTINSSLTITNAMKSYTGYFWVGTPSLNVCNASLTVLTSPSALTVNIMKNIESLSIVVQWDAVDDFLPTTYTVTWRDDGDLNKVATVEEQTSYTITGLTLDTVYAIRVTAANRCGSGPEFRTSVSLSTDTTSTTSTISPTVTASTNTANPSSSTITTMIVTNRHTTIMTTSISIPTTTTATVMMIPSTTTINTLTTTIDASTKTTKLKTTRSSTGLLITTTTATTTTTTTTDITTLDATTVTTSIVKTSATTATITTTMQSPSTTTTTTTTTATTTITSTSTPTTSVTVSTTPTGNSADTTTADESSENAEIYIIIVGVIVAGIVLVGLVFILFCFFGRKKGKLFDRKEYSNLKGGNGTPKKEIPMVTNPLNENDEQEKVDKSKEADVDTSLNPQPLHPPGTYDRLESVQPLHPPGTYDRLGAVQEPLRKYDGYDKLPVARKADNISDLHKDTDDDGKPSGIPTVTVPSNDGNQKSDDPSADDASNDDQAHSDVPTVTVPSSDDHTSDSANQNPNDPALHYAVLQTLPTPTGAYMAKEDFTPYALVTEI